MTWAYGSNVIHNTIMLSALFFAFDFQPFMVAVGTNNVVSFGLTSGPKFSLIDIVHSM